MSGKSGGSVGGVTGEDGAGNGLYSSGLGMALILKTEANQTQPPLFLELPPFDRTLGSNDRAVEVHDNPMGRGKREADY